MLEVSLIQWSRRQQHCSRMIGLRQAEQRLTLSPEKRSETPDVRRVESVRQNIGDDRSILESISRSRRRLRAVRQHPLAAIRRASQVHREQMQIRMPRTRDLRQCPQKGRIRKKQLRRK